MEKIKVNLNFGELKKGITNSITDVDGVTVGHYTIKNGAFHTGVTAILPHQGNTFTEKVIGANYVINGFGKSIGLTQIDELGTIESPIILTNTLSVGTCATGLIKYMLSNNEDIGVTTGTVNSVVCECNDGWLNDIRSFQVKEEHVTEAISNASKNFQLGAVGSGTGMKSFGLKGGIGSSSRVVSLDGHEYTLGILVMSNFGRLSRLTLCGKNIGKDIKYQIKNNLAINTQSDATEKSFCHCDKKDQAINDNESDKGSIIIVLATDIPLNERQLKRLCKRATIGLARTGSDLGNGSGDIVVGFTTANKQLHYEKRDIIPAYQLNENIMDTLFSAMADATEEAIIRSLLESKTTVGRDGHIAYSLSDFIEQTNIL